MIERILVANRGEIAVRVMRACREMGIFSVAVFSDADKDALFVKYADASCRIGPPSASQSYLDIPGIIEAAKECGCDAIHPGYGFLAENSEFAARCEQEGIRFIGPPSRVIALLGDKVAARREMGKRGVPVVPGTDECVKSYEHVRSAAEEIGYPVILKPAGGGGGIGMTVVVNDEALSEAFSSAQKIAGNTFGLSDVYVEKYLPNPRHIEFQILADTAGNAIHLGERECSIQRRHQKLIEESPSTAIDREMRSRMGQISAHAAGSLGYEGAGTVEFLFSDGKFYFLEVNARVQVEHPVTEMVTGIDIVKEQIRIASGFPLSVRQEDVELRGSAIECRINAEDPLNSFAPTPGKINRHIPPGGPGIRVDSGIAGSSVIPPFYDPIVSKLIVWGRNRPEAIERMKRALYEYILEGIPGNIPFHRAVMENERFAAGDLGTHFIDQETTLSENIKNIVAREQTLQNRLPFRSMEKKKIAAIAAVASVVRKQ